MQRIERCLLQSLLGTGLILFLGLGVAQAQQLEPRAYSPAPIGQNIIGLGALYTSGGVVTDPASLIKDVQAKVYGVAPYYARTFDFFGRAANVTAIAPYARANVRGDVQDQERTTQRSGMLDPRARFAVNLIGGPALSPPEFLKRKPETTVGASLTVSAPFGQYDPSKLVNLGTNRWACKPELGISKPFGKWIFELYAGVWLFEVNHNFYGGQVRKQSPLVEYQAHIVYEIIQHLWAAADFSYFRYGDTTVNGTPQNDRQNNTRAGLTLSVPIKQKQSVKVTWSRGVTTRVGSNFDTIGVAWQFVWL